MTLNTTLKCIHQGNFKGKKQKKAWCARILYSVVGLFSISIIVKRKGEKTLWTTIVFYSFIPFSFFVKLLVVVIVLVLCCGQDYKLIYNVREDNINVMDMFL